MNSHFVHFQMAFKMVVIITVATLELVMVVVLNV